MTELPNIHMRAGMSRTILLFYLNLSSLPLADFCRRAQGQVGQVAVGVRFREEWACL